MRCSDAFIEREGTPSVVYPVKTAFQCLFIAVAATNNIILQAELGSSQCPLEV